MSYLLFLLIAVLSLSSACERAAPDADVDAKPRRDAGGAAGLDAGDDETHDEHLDGHPTRDAHAARDSGERRADAGKPASGMSPSVPGPTAQADAALASVSFDDVAPVLERYCVGCHREEGAAPFRLDTYESASRHAAAIAAATRARTMPPWQITADGTCGDFPDGLRLSDANIELIGKWADSDAPGGRSQTIDIPPQPSLEGAQVYTTPPYVPAPAGGALAQHDDYHCVLVDPELPGEQFITAYNIVPHDPKLVHHAIAYMVDPEQASLVPGMNNGTLIALHDSLSPEVGWRCMVEAGEGVTMVATPATWFPGQPPMEMPNESGLRVKPRYRYVLQVHYNLEPGGGDAAHDGAAHGHDAAVASAVRDPSDSQVSLHFRYAEKVKNEGFSVTGDGLLATLTQITPTKLPAGKASVPFQWKRTMRELYMMQPEAELWAVYPHMHELGNKYRMTIQTPGESARCAADMQRWDFHWQRMYTYRTPVKITPDTIIDVTCDYDTTERAEDVLPGMGTSNEMCSSIMYVTAPMRAAP
jgi:hypothetical protein